MAREFSIIRNIALASIALEVVQRRPTGTDRGWIERYSERLESPEWDFERDDEDASPPVVVGPIRYPEKGFFPEYTQEGELPATRFGAIAFVGDIAYVGNAYGRWVKLPVVEQYYLLPDGNHRISAAILLKMEHYPVVRQLRGSYVEALDYASGPANSGSRFLFYAPEKGARLAKVLCKFENPELLEIWWRRVDTEIAAECAVSPPVVKTARDRFLSSQPLEVQKRLINLAATKFREDGSEVRTDFRGRRLQKEKSPVTHPPAPFSPPVPVIQIQLDPKKNYSSPNSVPQQASSTPSTPREPAENGKTAREVKSIFDDFGLKNATELRERLEAFEKLQQELDQTVSELQEAWDEIDKLKKSVSPSVRLAS